MPDVCNPFEASSDIVAVLLQSHHKMSFKPTRYPAWPPRLPADLRGLETNLYAHRGVAVPSIVFRVATGASAPSECLWTGRMPRGTQHWLLEDYIQGGGEHK